MNSNLFPGLPLYRIPEEDNEAYSLSENRNAFTLVILDTLPSESERSFLTKIFSAVNQDLDKDVCLIYKKKDRDSSLIPHIELNSNGVIIVFGPTPKNIGLQCVDQCYIPLIIGSKYWLFSHPLQSLENDQKNKMLLWNALQKIYNK